jgi:hypothetical protein
VGGVNSAAAAAAHDDDDDAGAGAGAADDDDDDNDDDHASPNVGVGSLPSQGERHSQRSSRLDAVAAAADTDDDDRMVTVHFHSEMSPHSLQVRITLPLFYIFDRYRREKFIPTNINSIKQFCGRSRL